MSSKRRRKAREWMQKETERRTREVSEARRHERENLIAKFQIPDSKDYEVTTLPPFEQNGGKPYLEVYDTGYKYDRFLSRGELYANMDRIMYMKLDRIRFEAKQQALRLRSGKTVVWWTWEYKQ